MLFMLVAVLVLFMFIFGYTLGAMRMVRDHQRGADNHFCFECFNRGCR